MATGRGTTGGRREVLAVLLVGLVVLVTALVGPLAPRYHDAPDWLFLGAELPTPPPPAAATAPADADTTAQLRPIPGWLSQTMKWLAVAVLVTLVVLLLRYVARALMSRWRAIDRGGEGGEAGGRQTLDEIDDLTTAALQEGVARAGQALREELPPGDAVVAAWLALEHAAAASGVVHDPTRTATEFTLALLDRTRADRAAARTLLGLYHRARFSDHVVSAGDVATARAALAVLAAVLPVAEVAPGPASGAGPASTPERSS